MNKIEIYQGFIFNYVRLSTIIIYYEHRWVRLDFRGPAFDEFGPFVSLGTVVGPFMFLL
jgi:hypothetical protein